MELIHLGYDQATAQALYDRHKSGGSPACPSCGATLTFKLWVDESGPLPSSCLITCRNFRCRKQGEVSLNRDQ